MRRTLMVPAAAVSMALLACGVAAADSVTTDFESFTFSTVNGQQGWKSAPPGAILPCIPLPTGGQIDQGVFPTPLLGPLAPAAFEQRSLRMSNACSSTAFYDQTYSAPVADPAGENQANTEYSARFSFISKIPGSEQPGLNVSVSPDSNEGSRMSYVGLRDTEAGIRVTVFDTPEVDGEFVAYDAGVLDREVPHTIRFWIKVNPGPDNDLVRIFIDGRDLGQCFTTWENYYRTAPEQAPPPNVNTPASINSLQFRSSVPGPDFLAGGGYLFDNVTVTTANGPGPAGCDLVIDKEADARTVSAGGLAGYRITVRNRGRAVARNVRVCDRIPRGMTFVGANRTLSRLGRQRCLVIPLLRPGQRVSFDLVLQVDGDAQGTVANIADITPGAGSPAAPAADVPAGVAVDPKATARARATVKVLTQAGQRRLPPVTG
jgi:uncharacterized repeat protein (TIGR01451 family)